MRPDERLRRALRSVGTPILQSASSTILGVSFLSSTESYVFSSFFKTIILIILFGVLHGLIILPILLTIFSSKQKSDEDSPPTQPVYSLNSVPYGNVRRVSSCSSIKSTFDPSLELYHPWMINTPPIIPPRMSSYGLIKPCPSFQTLPYLSNPLNYTETLRADEYFVPVQTMKKSPGMAH